MTTTEIDALPAGTATDRLVTDAAGVALCECEHRRGYTESCEPGELSQCVDCGKVAFVPEFSTDIAVAWLLVDLAQGLVELSRGWVDCNSEKPIEWTARLRAEGIGYGFAPTAPLAICKAFLKARGK